MTDPDTIAAYDFDLPPSLIAQHPPADRDGARMMILDRGAGTIEHAQFRDLPARLSPGDLAVFNTTRVLPARLRGHRTATGGRWEGLFLREETHGRWRIFGKTKGKIQPGETVRVQAPLGQDVLDLTMLEKAGGEWVVRPQEDTPAVQLLETYGTMPLPPYITRDGEDPDDRERYQTVFAGEAGAIAAPTAGLHFTNQTLAELSERGVVRADVTLHVGAGTFRPVTAERLDEHVMHTEMARVPQATVDAVAATRAAGRRVLAVGTTAVRSLESAAVSGQLHAFAGETELFIRPGFTFHAVDALLTNFHLPKSTLLVLVSTLAGRDLTRRAYREAVAEEYRFFSYGDAMLIL